MAIEKLLRKAGESEPNRPDIDFLGTWIGEIFYVSQYKLTSRTKLAATILNIALHQILHKQCLRNLSCLRTKFN